MDVLPISDPQRVLLVQGLTNAAEIMVSQSLLHERSLTAADVQRTVEAAVHGLALPVATCWAQRDLLRNRVGTDPRLLRAEHSVPVTLSPRAIDTLCQELTTALNAILHDNPEPLLRFIRAVRSRVPQNAPFHGAHTADRLLECAEATAEDRTMTPTMRVLHLLELRQDIGSEVPGGEPGIFVYPPHPLEPWTVPYQQYWHNVPTRIALTE